MKPGMNIELMGPLMRNHSFTIDRMEDEKGAPLEQANPNSRVIMALPEGACSNDLLRMEKQ